MNKGSILIITLWILAILAILSIGIGGRMGLELKLTGFNRDSTAALYLAKAGVERAISVILSKKDHTVDSLNEAWSCNNEDANPLFKEVKIGGGYFTVSYPFYNKRVFYGSQDEEGRININNAPRDVIARLISSIDPTVAGTDEIAANIEDWRDQDAVRQDGSPEYDYTEEGYKRKDAFFDSVDEVLLVKGVDRGLFDKIKGYITVYPVTNSGCQVNINTAPLPVLEALGFSAEQAGSIISARAGPDGLDGTKDDVPFINKDAFTAYLVNTGMSLTPPANIGLVSCGSNFFRIESKGYASSGRVVKTVTCVISVTDGSILYWNEE